MQAPTSTKSIDPYYQRLEKIASNTLILQATGFAGGHFITLLLGSAIPPLSLSLGAATYIMTRQGLFHLMAQSDWCKYKPVRNVVKLIASLNAFCVAATVSLMLAPIAFKVMLITNVTFTTLTLMTIWFSRYKSNNQ